MIKLNKCFFALQVQAKDDDSGVNGQIVYTMINDALGIFELRNTNQIYAKGVVKNDGLTITIKAEDKTNPASLR